jgi:hypothetical protein
MSPVFTDPNNHAPAVTADDGWGDVEGYLRGPLVIEEMIEDFEEESPSMLPLAELPPKRTKEPSFNLVAPPKETGLRIEPQIHRYLQEEIDSGITEEDLDRSIVRLAPEMPNVQKAPRQIAFQERPPRTKRERRLRGESNEWGKASRSSMRWIVGVFVAIAGIVIISLGVLPMINEVNAARPPQEELVVEKDDISEEIVGLKEMFTRKSEATQIFMNFVSAKSADDILPWVRNRAKVEDLIRSKPWLPQAPPDWNPPGDFNWQAYQENGQPIGILESPLPYLTCPAFYFIMTDGKLQLDWKASTGYGTAGFTDLTKGVGDGSEIRAIISKSDFYTNTFPEAAYKSYQLFSPKEEVSIWVYSRRGEPADSELGRLLDKGAIIDEAPDRIKLTLRLSRSVDGGLPNQWLVEEILHNDWIHP